jgi:hypothetical protein
LPCGEPEGHCDERGKHAEENGLTHEPDLPAGDSTTAGPDRPAAAHAARVAGWSDGQRVRAGTARPAVGGTDLPFKSSFTGTSTLNLQTGHVHNVSSGPASHFGIGLIEQDGYLVPDPTRPGVFTLITSITLTAANGDQLFGSCTGPVTTTDGVHFLLSVTCSTSTGTGRLAQADLDFTVTGVSTRVSVEGGIATQRVEGTAEGLLSYH